MTKLSDEALDELVKGCEGVTPEPWKVLAREEMHRFDNKHSDDGSEIYIVGYDIVSDDGRFIVGPHGIPALEIGALRARLLASAPDLLDTIQSLRREKEALREGLKRVIEAAERSLGDHIAPHDCFATGPLTGNPIADLVACPGCGQLAEIEDARALLSSRGQK